MARQTYSVDWTDPAFPAVVRTEDVWDPDDWDRLTLADVKQQIINHFQSQIDHAREQIRIVRALRAADIQKADQED